MPQTSQSRILKIVDAPPSAGYITEGLKLINAPTAWEDTRGQGIVVGVLDTGCDRSHPDLAANIIGGDSFVPGENWYEDNNGHGTHVAGTIAANGQLLGVAPEAKLWIGKVMNRNGFGSYAGVARGIRRAVRLRRQGVPIAVLSLSLGGPQSNWDLRRAIREAINAGILVVCAAGNQGDGDPGTIEIDYPAYYPESTAVGAVDFNLMAANFTNSNREIDLAGPGVDIYSTWPGGQYVLLSGTSMATPHVSGFAALVASKFYLRCLRLPAEPELYAMVRLLTVDVEAAGIDTETGAGLVSFLPWPGPKAACP